MTEPSTNSQDACRAARERLIVALDVPSIAAAEALVTRLGESVVFYKIGLGLQLAGGDRFARDLKAMRKRVFLDYKYYDIGETICNAVARAAELDIDFLTIHGTGNILEAAVAGKGGSKLKLFCVTVLTSIEADDFRQMGYKDVDIESVVVHRARQAMRAGCDGVIASAREAARIKKETEAGFLVTTPGIRPSGTDVGDQKRVTTPADAIRSGADYLVVGRPISQSAEPAEAADMIVAEMAQAWKV